MSQPKFAPARGGQSSGPNYAIRGSSRVRRARGAERAGRRVVLGSLSRVDLDPKRLLTLAAIAEHGGIAAAARVLGTTPSAVSQQLGRLEQDAGLPLVDRSGGRLVMTVAGRLLAGYGERVERTLFDAARELGALAGQATGPVNIGVMLSAIPDVAATALPWLAEHHPGIEPRLIEAYGADGLRALRVGELDILMISDDRDTALAVPPGVHSFVIFESRYRIVVPESWTMPSTPADLDGRVWVGAPAHTARGRAFARFAAEHGVTPGVEHSALHPSAARAMVAAQVGAALLPEFTAVTVPRATVCAFDVPGSFLVRLFRRRMSDRSVPAVDAAAIAICEAMTEAAIRYSDAPYAPSPVRVTNPRDPSH